MTGGAEPPPRSFEHTMGLVLRWGVYIAVGMFLVGLLLTATSGFSTLDSQGYPDLFQPTSVGQFGAGVLLLGLVVLVVTPVVRVALASVLFAERADRTYVGLTLFVLAVLLATVVAGRYA